MSQDFNAIIKQHEGINGAYVEMPFDVKEVYGSKRIKVRATFDGIEYRGSVVNMGGCYMLGITQELRSKIGKGFGEEVFVTLEKDLEERVVEVPEDFASAMNREETAVTTFKSLSYTAQKEYVAWITSAKREVTRLERIIKAVALLSEGKRLK